MGGRRASAPALRVVVLLDGDEEVGVRGEIEAPGGTRRFTGWLDLMGQLEALVDRARPPRR